METLPVPYRPAPSPYEQQALHEIRLWREREMGWFGAVVHRINTAVHHATDLVRRLPGVDWTIDTVVAGLLKLTNEIVQDSVWRDAIYAEYRKAGHDFVRAPADVRRLDLRDVDGRLQGLAGKYRALAAAEGAATGYAGAAGILPDVVALVALNLRAAGEYATYCGFDLQEESERLFALQILNAVSQPSDVAKHVTLAPIIRVSQHVAKDQAARVVEEYALARAMQNVARALGVRLTQSKLAQVVPVAGAAVASGFNAYYTSKVCDAAYYLYRERFLLARYGPDLAAW